MSLELSPSPELLISLSWSPLEGLGALNEIQRSKPYEFNLCIFSAHKNVLVKQSLANFTTLALRLQAPPDRQTVKNRQENVI